jgi:Alw26I/Eco31I/Esp3I family type II restriction m6 adenine DNA methyltransferase
MDPAAQSQLVLNVIKRKKIHDHPELLGMPEVKKLWQTQELLSDHYLKARLSKNDWWPTDDTVRPIWEFCRDLYNKRYLALAKNNEAFTRQELIDKVLEKLGFAWTDNLGLPDQDAEPDYILFTNPAEKESVLDKDTASRYRAASAILEAKKLNHPLSQVSKHQQRYPHQQIRDYLQDAQVLSWGILTNGNEWRLYCRDARRQDLFALNFEVAIQSVENFKYFLVLFCPDSFQRDAQGKCRLDLVREQSLSAQSELEEDLRQRIFTILTDLANGFASRPENQIPDSEDGHKTLYENCLIYLYRLLFILYAEGRGLLPVEPRTRRYYKELSLQRLKPDLKNFTGYDSRTRTRLGEDISELVHLVNGIDEAKNKEYSVARYNGGLFDSGRHRLLEDWRIADADVAHVLRGLMFDPPPKPNEPALPVQTVDFGDLRVQQLGSIYEGLLEHHFVRNAQGRLELKTDKAERKATGTYYTPDYIVKYIVEQTLSPLLDEIERSEPVKAARTAARQDNSFANAVLALNVCDPAMGSGHFLVEAITVLADQIAAHPTTRRLHENSKDEEELAYWRRRVVEACIYGVDLNPLAVELAKLSLWLTCIASDQPLNFLDHHLRTGNSLIGARLDQLGSLPQKRAQADAKQMRFMFGPDFKHAVAETIHQIQEIENESSSDVGSVKAKERRWEADILPRLASYKRVADLWTRTFFDGPLSEEDYLTAAKSILVEAETSGDSLHETAPHRLLKEFDRPYFHWELEFPDVFFFEDGVSKANPGFDAVIGNPPYDVVSEKEQQREVEADKEFFQLVPDYSAAVGHKLNFYRLFVAQALRLLRKNGFHSFIVPMALLGDAQAKALREHLLARTRFDLIEAFPQKDDPRDRVFFGAKLSTCLYLLQNAATSTFRVRVHPGKAIKAESPVILTCEVEIRKFDPENLSIPCYPGSTAADFKLALKLSSGARGSKLGDFARSQQGEVNLTTHREFLSDEAVGPVALRGANIGRYFLNDEPKQGKPKFLRREAFLRAHGPDTKAYDHRFKRIGYQRGAAIDNWRRIIATIIEPQNFCSDTVNYIVQPKQLDLYAILALLSSSVWEWRFRLTSTNNHVNAYEIDGMPMPHFVFTTLATRRAALAAAAKKVYASALAAEDDSGVLIFVQEQLLANPGRSDVVHDLLAFLAGRMMDLNQRQRAVARQFLTDLKDFHGIDARALNPKTKLDEFWKLDTAEVFAHLKKNRKALAEAKLDLNETAENKIRSRFEQSKSAILPLEAQIVFTDALIDRIVYRLYALTPEEINIVQNAATFSK